MATAHSLSAWWVVAAGATVAVSMLMRTSSAGRVRVSLFSVPCFGTADGTDGMDGTDATAVWRAGLWLKPDGREHAGCGRM